jgi:octaprenyl-diphosphate synthase
MEIAPIRNLIADDMQAVNRLILERLRSDVVLINQIGHYIISSGGKRLRPMIVLLAAHAAGYRGDRHIDLAAIIEFIHTATLLHDDVVDGSEKRRSRDTANAVWGNAASVLVGDFLYSRSFEMMVDIGRNEVMEVLSTATNRIAEGEVLQLLNVHEPDTTEHQYLEVIQRKTATLFEAGSRLGAVLADSDPDHERAMAEFGLHLGIAFQLIDDALDYSSSNQEMGKNVGDDLAEGKPTLPVIRALQTAAPAHQGVLREAIETGGLEQIQGVISAIESTDAIAYTAALAKREAALAKAALAPFPDSPHREALQGLADFAVNRTS